IVTAMDRLVGTLEQFGFAVFYEFDRGIAVIRVEMLDGGGGNHDGGGYIVLDLELGGRMKILTQAEDAPGAVGVVADAQEVGDELAVPAFQFVAGRAVDDVDTEVLAPLIAPFGAIEAFHDEDQFLDVLRDGGDPFVVFRRVILHRWREQFDDGAEGTFGTEDGALVLSILGRILEAAGVIAPHQAGNLVEILFEIGDEDRALDHRVGDRLGDFRFAAAGDGAGFVAERGFGDGAHEAPGAIAGGLLHLDAIAGRAHVNLVGQQLDAFLLTVLQPGDGLLVQIEVGVARNVEDVGETFVTRVAFGLEVHGFAAELDHLLERMAAIAHVAVAEEFLAQIVAGVDQGAAGVLLLAQTGEVGGVADLRLHLFLAVTEIIVGDDGHDHAAFVARGDLEGAAVVVTLVLLLPAHAIALLAFSGLVPMRQAEALFGQLHEVGCEDDAAGVSAPVGDVERGVVFGQERIAAVAEDAFDEIEIGHEAAGGEEADFHPFLLGETRHFGTNDRPQEQ